MSKSIDNYKHKYERIIYSAREIFLRAGYDGTSMDDVAASAGVTKQTVYRYFPSKLALFSAVVEKMAEHNDDYVFGRLGIMEELIRYGEKYISEKLRKDQLDIWRLTIGESTDGSQVADVLRCYAQNELSKTLVDFLKDRILLTEPELYADMYISMLMVIRPKLVMGICSAPDDYEIRKHAEVTAEIFVNGVLGL